MKMFDTLVKELSQKDPKPVIKFKNESLFMKILGIILFFNKDFMNKFITTIGNKVYFPSKKQLEENELDSMVVLCHEYVHMNDSNSIGALIYSFFYLFPLSLAVFMLLLFPFSLVLALIFLVVCLLPLPAYWRMKYEMRGYKMSLFAINEIMKANGKDETIRRTNLAKAAEKTNLMFTTSAYYFMWPFGVLDELNKTVNKIISGDILSEDRLYKEIADALTVAMQTSPN